MKVTRKMKGDIMLKEIILKKNIELNVSARNWEEAIQKGGQLLMNTGCIEQEYIQGMINGVKEFGPYIVIAPNIAMPHAKPEMGAKKIGFSLLTLQKPIEFGHPQNDPVDVVICLSAVDHSTHLEALSDLVNYLSDPDFLPTLRKARTTDEVIDYLNKK